MSNRKQTAKTTALHRVTITEVKNKGQVIGFNVRRNGNIIAGPFETRSEAKRWMELAYGNR